VSVSSSVLQLTVMLRDVTFAKHALSAWPITTHWSSRNRVTDRLGREGLQPSNTGFRNIQACKPIAGPKKRNQDYV